ncbi:MAG: zinc ribbon domain-containing protein, partial [Chloroflexia bacterium]|nr:zinc ribbon domain-containing protein [Chloroflexia bacterium]
MPKYDFACDDCGALFERERPVEERDAPVSCPVCATLSRRKVSSP